MSATVFEILMLKATKWLNFPTPPLFEAPARGNLVECRDEIWHQKMRIVGLPDGEQIMKFLRFFFLSSLFVLIQYRRVTDGRTEGHVALAKTRASIASRG